ncbi:hypothetical protein [Vibrio vulnificus]|nr:hypothetical protein [Vibrio vulnificus]
MPRIIEYIGEETEISDYLPEHYPENQSCQVVKGIFINPNLRDDFDCTPNDEREFLENEHWYGRAYIVTDEFKSETYQEFANRVAKYDPKYQLESESEFNERNQQAKAAWLKAWPTGATCVTQECDGELLWWSASVGDVTAARQVAKPDTGLMPLIGLGAQVHADYYLANGQEVVANDWQKAVVTIEQFTGLES